jgi:prepilin peptidase CpaA
MQPVLPSSATNAVNVNSIPAFLVLALMLAIAVYVELKEMRIPNWLTFSGMSLGLLIAYLHGTPAFVSSIVGLLIGFGFLFIFYVFGGVGGGDVKLMGAAGALMGSALIRPALVYTAFIGAFLAVMMVIWRKDFWMRIAWGIKRLAFWRKGDVAELTPPVPVAVPYGMAIALGCLLALLIGAAV